MWRKVWAFFIKMCSPTNTYFSMSFHHLKFTFFAIKFNISKRSWFIINKTNFLRISQGIYKQNYKAKFYCTFILELLKVKWMHGYFQNSSWVLIFIRNETVIILYLLYIFNVFKKLGIIIRICKRVYLKTNFCLSP